ncbi:MAG: class I SAM-dependent methyltransferase [Gammaproteobacteria bacterium]|nr:class I SAM-dependent methyltransferase [Gammaproteobacteria bacterium]
MNSLYKTPTLNKSVLRELARLDSQSLFSEIYQKGYWGSSSQQPFYSGSGSHDKSQTLPYINAVKSLINSLPESPVIIDLGCGDFNIGRQLYSHSQHYHAVDIVPELINYNQQCFKANNLTFKCMNATNEKLPDGDILLIRQVFQHLENNEIKAVLKQASHYPYIIVTEHLPEGTFTPNKDKPTGPDSRLRMKSGVDISAAPFSFSGTGMRGFVRLQPATFQASSKPGYTFRRTSCLSFP